MTRVLKSNTTTIVVDFCVHTFSKDLEDRKGFEVYYSSTPSKVYVHGAQDSPGRHEDEQIEGQSAAGGKKNLCGRPQNPPSNNPNRIVNGVLARENSWPWICSLVQKPTLQFCGCTLVSALRCTVYTIRQRLCAAARHEGGFRLAASLTEPGSRLSPPANHFTLCGTAIQRANCFLHLDLDHDMNPYCNQAR